MEPEKMFDERLMAVNVSMYKQLGFYQLLDPSGLRVFGYHVYLLIVKMWLLISQLIMVFGVMGYYIKPEDFNTYNGPNIFEMISIYMLTALSSLKLYTIVSNINIIWGLFDLMYIDFLQCFQNNKDITADFIKRCKRSAAIATFISYNFIVIGFLWTIIPLVKKNPSESLNNDKQRYQNVLNFMYPVTVEFYNKYYFVFYLLEVSVVICSVFGYILFDVCLMSFCWIISAQYQLIKSAFEQCGHDKLLNKNCKAKMYDDFKSIIIDHQKVYLKIKSFNSIIQPIVLIHIFICSCAMIIFVYLTVRILHSKEPIVLEIIKMILSLTLFMIQIFVVCFSLEHVNKKNELVNFGIYSCDWTEMDIKFKKLLLLSLKMNNANKLKLNATPKIAIDRQLFTYVVRTCFNIISVLI